MIKKSPSFIGFYFSILILLISSCKKDVEIIVPDNNAPYYGGVPTVLIENYVNRIYIDLIGREPLDAEMVQEVQFLKDNNLSTSARIQIITKLQTNTDYIPGDSSYMYAYYNRFYELCKARVLEATGDDVISQYAGIAHGKALQDSTLGDSLAFALGMQIARNYYEVLDCQEDYRMDSIEIKDVFASMLNNGIYDKINMNTFNFLNASFDNLFYRYPSPQEFNAGLQLVEYNKAEILFGKSGQNKGDYIQILVNSSEFYEGVIKWMYKTLLARDPSTQETYTIMKTFFYDHDVQKVQLYIMKGEEYANF